MAYYPDMGQQTQCIWHDNVRAIGWLEPGHPYTEGTVPAEFLARLRDFASRSVEPTAAAGFILFGCSYTCKFCGRAQGRFNFGVPAGDLLFVAPELVVHHIEAHGYAPPQQFIDAVMTAPLPGTPEYCAAVERFRKHREWLDEVGRRSLPPKTSTAQQSTGVTTDLPDPPQ
jgi:hypothetical protein